MAQAPPQHRPRPESRSWPWAARAIVLAALAGGAFTWGYRTAPPPRADVLRPVARRAAWTEPLRSGRRGGVVAAGGLGALREVLGEQSLDLARAERRDGRFEIALDGGRRAVLALEPTVQDAAQAVLDEHEVVAGAFVAVEIGTGRVVALASRGDLPGGKGPMALRATQPAASVFKIVTAAALLESGAATPSTRLCVRGGHRGVTAALLRADRRRDRRCVTMAQALARSDNVYFARMALRYLDARRLSAMARKLGFGHALPLPVEVMPSQIELPPDGVAFAAAAAGFHHVTLSPLHAATIAAAVARDGNLPVPLLVSQVVDADGTVVYEARPQVWRTALRPEDAHALASMMRLTCTRGTAAKYLARFPVPVAGKTGTLSEVMGDGVRRYNSWFVGFVPADAPRLAFAALVVNGARWRLKAVPFARRVLEAWLAQTASAPHR